MSGPSFGSSASAVAPSAAGLGSSGLRPAPPGHVASSEDLSHNRKQMMPLRSKIILKNDLSQETLHAVRGYLTQFLDRRHSLEHFDGSFSIYLRDPADARLLRQQFASLIADVQDVR